MTLEKFLTSLILIVAILGLLAFGFFNKLLPILTNKDKVVSVPDIKGMSVDEASDFLKSKDLDFTVNDTAYNLEKAPLIILEQYPRPNAKVKVNRKIHLTINALNPPTVSFPDLNGVSFDFAVKQLKTLDLKIGSIEYRPDIAHNAILESKVNESLILPEQKISKGTTINLIIGSPNDKFPMPDFKEMQLDEVETVVAGLNLKIIQLNNVNDDLKKDNVVQRHLPEPGDTVRHGDMIQLWVYNLNKKE